MEATYIWPPWLSGSCHLRSQWETPRPRPSPQVQRCVLLREQPLYVLPTRRTPALGALQAHRAPALSGGSRSGRHCDGDERRGRRGAGAGADAGRGGRRRRVSAAAAGRVAVAGSWSGNAPRRVSGRSLSVACFDRNALKYSEPPCRLEIFTCEIEMVQ